MQTQYIKFYQQVNDPVFGLLGVDWISTSLVRVTRNRIGNAHFEWVGNVKAEFDLDDVHKSYQVAKYV